MTSCPGTVDLHKVIQQNTKTLSSVANYKKITHKSRDYTIDIVPAITNHISIMRPSIHFPTDHKPYKFLVNEGYYKSPRGTALQNTNLCQCRAYFDHQKRKMSKGIILALFVFACVFQATRAAPVDSEVVEDEMEKRSVCGYYYRCPKGYKFSYFYCGCIKIKKDRDDGTDDDDDTSKSDSDSETSKSGRSDSSRSSKSGRSDSSKSGKSGRSDSSKSGRSDSSRSGKSGRSDSSKSGKSGRSDSSKSGRSDSSKSSKSGRSDSNSSNGGGKKKHHYYG